MVANIPFKGFPRIPKPSASDSDAVRVLEADGERGFPDVTLTGAMLVLAFTCVGLKLYVLLGAASFPHVFGS